MILEKPNRRFSSLTISGERLLPENVLECYNLICNAIKKTLKDKQIKDEEIWQEEKNSRLANAIAVKYSFKLYSYLYKAIHTNNMSPVHMTIDHKLKSIIVNSYPISSCGNLLL